MSLAKRADIANSNIHYMFYPFTTFLECQRRLGFKKVDLFGATPHVWIDAYQSSDGEEYRKMLQDHGLEPGVFIPESSSMRYTLGSTGAEWEKTWEYLKRCLDFAAGFGAEEIVVSVNGFLLDIPEEERTGQLYLALSKLCGLSAGYGIRVALKNDFHDKSSMARTLDEMKRCMGLCDAENLCVAMDTASVYEAGETPRQWFDAFGEKIGYVMLTNTKFDGSAHCWGDGYLNLSEILHTLDEEKYQGPAGFSCMVRDYLSEPWKADESTLRMLDLCGMEGQCDA